MLKRHLPAVLLALATLSCAAPGTSGQAAQPPEITVDQGAAGSTVSLRQGQRLAVFLPGNPTTGFLWELEPGTEPVLVLQGEPHFAPAGTALGSGGVYRFTFQAVRPGSVPVRIIYRRPFEKNAAPARSFEVTVVVGVP